MMPPHAYVPGQTPRHPDGLFDAIRETAKGAVTPEKIVASQAWKSGLDYYRKGYFWEAHEVLEPIWLAAPPNSAHRRVAQAIIQLANAALKQKMGRGNAALRLCGIAATHLAEAGDRAAEDLGITGDWIRAEIAGIRHDLRHAK